MTGPWVRLDLVGLHYIHGADVLPDDPLGGSCYEARVETGVAFRRLPPRGLGLRRPNPHRHDVRSLLIAQLIVLGAWKLWELVAWAIAALLRGG